MKNMRNMTLAMGVSTLLLVATQIQAEQPRNCAPREKVVDRLAEKFGETRQSIGLGGNNAVVEVFASQDTGSWTITVTLANGMTCLLASGQAFEALVEALPPAGNDA